MKQCHTKGREKSPEAVRDYPSPRGRGEGEYFLQREARLARSIERSTSNVQGSEGGVVFSFIGRSMLGVGRWMLKPQRPDHCATKVGRALLSWGSLAGRSLRLQ